MPKVTIKIELLDHISAGELRELGIPIPENIPDDWITKRGSVVPMPETLTCEMDGDTLHASFKMQCMEPFRAPLVYELEK
jgi:hypothetical protein